MKKPECNQFSPKAGNAGQASGCPQICLPESSTQGRGEGTPRTVYGNVPGHSRRDFLSMAGLAAASFAVPGAVRSAAASVVHTKREFEVAASLYAWELHDEGIEKILDNLQGMADVNSVYLVALMHYEKRPLTSPIFPHNPVRKMWQAEDSRVYWHPDMKLYGRIKPQLSEFGWLNETDWLKVLTGAARKRGLKTGAEISHTVMSLEEAEGSFSDCVQRDIHGAPLVFGRTHPICPNSPDAQQYVLALFSDLTSNYDVDFLQTCLVPFMRGGADKGGCFCGSCVKAAKEHGIDLEKVRTVLLANPQASAELEQWQSFREASLIRFYKIMHDGIHGIRPGAELRFNDAYFNPRECGMDLKGLTKVWDSIRNSDYSEQKGDPALMSHKREWFAAERAAIGPDFPFIAGVAVRPKATPELIHEGVKIALEFGAIGVSLGHYDGAEFPMLRAIREQLTAENVQVPRRLEKKRV
jgi:hypothetical protein